MRRNALTISTFSVFAFAIAGWYYGADPLDCSLRAMAAGVGVYFIARFYSKLAEKIMLQPPGAVQHPTRGVDGEVNEESNN